MTRQVLSVGQCGPDQAAINRFLKGNFDVAVTTVDTGPEAVDAIRKQTFDLVLLNRKLDIDYSDGLEILRVLKADPDLQTVPVMLVTNYPEYQAQAVAAGAEHGFGKQELGRSDTVRLLQPFLA